MTRSHPQQEGADDRSGHASFVQRRFPGVALLAIGLELVREAEALERAGRHAEAALRARAFVKENPKSPLADRMRRIAGE